MFIRRILNPMCRMSAAPARPLSSSHSTMEACVSHPLRRHSQLADLPAFSDHPARFGIFSRCYASGTQSERRTDPDSVEGYGGFGASSKETTGTRMSSEQTQRPIEDKAPSPKAEASSPEAETKLQENITKLEAEKKETMDKYLRALAETENVRNRLTRQIADAKQFGIQSFVKDLLEVSDILTKAMESTPQEAFDQKNPHFDNLFEGLRLTEAQMTKVFKKHGLEKMDPMGEKFDPNQHEALFEAPAEGKETGTVMSVTQTGYKLNNRVIRPARVGVVRNAS
ncbi:hypothetical protein RvY_06042 [Ramazzottius varieornatus]|uniref:GrpE protein homolog n=1 Tax=Ramazzottius varieornatus TaxID=947166 RepID=A0A1D1V0Q1_RAMVA|nr:hypothetical protein RvY_06042 [Ramazzottius varieornatus]